MAKSVPLVVFSDLDGTLLDHATYSWDAAREAITQLSQIGAPLVLASSKTAAEMAEIQWAMGLTGVPAIVENGAGLTGIGGQADGAEYLRLRAALGSLPDDLRAPFESFGDMDVARVEAITGLDRADAARARTRQFSEPGVWHGAPSEEKAFIAALDALGISARRGGRFLTLSFGKTKADRMAQIIAQYRPTRTLALGDAPNDIEMLEAADHGVIIANSHHAPLPVLPGEAQGRITRTTREGPEGWNTAVLDLIEHLKHAAGRT